MLPDLLLKFKARAQGGLRFHSRLQLQLSPHDRRSCQLCATEMRLSRASVSSEQAGSQPKLQPLAQQTSLYVLGFADAQRTSGLLLFDVVVERRMQAKAKRSEIEVYVAK